jgi:DNA ligase (NAD+)
MRHDSFARLNEKRDTAGLPVFANPRNATAGSLKQLDPRATAQRDLYFYAHGRGVVEPDVFESYAAFVEALRAWGLPVSHAVKTVQDIDGVWQYHPRVRQPAG